MGVNKQGSKSGGGYVDGFLHLFDWKAKSKKKMLSYKSELPALVDQSKQGKRTDKNMQTQRLYLTDEDANIAGSSIRGSSDYSCASSLTDDESYVSKPPGVVARLMGLDSLPTYNFADPCITPFSGSLSLRNAHYERKNLEFPQNHQTLHSGNLLISTDKPDMRTSEPEPQKMPSRPIEKFQTEILPPRSAKSISVTHHKLFSPIKNPSFISKDPAHIMEAAAKIIDSGPQMTARAKRPHIGASSIPLKVRDLKEKAEAAQKIHMSGSSSVTSGIRDLKERAEASTKRSKLDETPHRPVESNAAKYLKGQSLYKSWDGPDTTSFRVLHDTGESTADLGNKGKSISLAIQAKVNVQRRENQNIIPSRSLGGQKKEQSEFKSSLTSRTQSNNQKSTNKKYPTQNVLKQNNQKQNSLMDLNKLPARPSVNLSRARKQLSADSSFGRHRSLGKLAGSSKHGTRKMDLESTGVRKEELYSNTNNFPRKKRIISREFHFEKNSSDYVLGDKYEKPNEPIPSKDSHLHWAEDSRKNGNDVISFTFTAPMTRSNQLSQRNNKFSTDYRDKKTNLNSDRTKLSSSLGFNVIGSDALSILLEQKLREVTIGDQSSGGDSATSSDSILQHFSRTANTFSSNPSNLHGKMSPYVCTDRRGSQSDSGFSSNATLMPRNGHKFQEMNEMDTCSSNHIEDKQLFDCRHPSPISILEPTFSIESSNSSDSNNSNILEGIKQCSSSIQAQETLEFISLKKMYFVDGDIELTDSASSIPIETTRWELEYVKEIISNVELMLNDFALGRVTKIINPTLYYQLENKKHMSDSNTSISQRKVLFDCVGECLDLRCRRYLGGGRKALEKGLLMVRRKDRLAEEVYKEISGLEKMGDSMVDELVDKDMSGQYGRWADFEVEAFEIGVEIQNQMLNSLINEVVADVFRG